MIARRILRYFSAREEPRLFRWLLPLVFAASLPLYFLAARAHARTFNHDRFRNDQNVFLHIAQRQRETDFQAMTERQRTPGFAYLLAPFWSEDLRDPADPGGVGEEWFERAKTVSIGISVVLLLLLLACACCATGVFEAVFFTFAAAFLLFVFRAGYTQPEVSYWTFSVICFCLAGRMLVRPTWMLAVVTGLATAVAYLMKAGIQPLLVLFVACLIAKLLWDRFYHRRDVTVAGLARGLLVPLTYLVVLSPYFYQSYRMFGNPFFNSHAKFMMWIPDGDKTQMYALQNIGSDSGVITEEAFQEEYVRLVLKADEAGTVRAADVRPPKLPTFGNYARDYGFSEVPWRPANGLHANHKRMRKYYPAAYGFLELLVWCALGIAVLAWRRVLPDARDHLPLVLYVLGYFAGYLFLYAWYDGLRLGVRLILSLYLPAVAALVLFIGHYARDLRLRARGQTIYLRKILNLVLAILLAIAIHGVLTDELYRHYSGA